jgi:S1-C subfamily serine protease
MSEPQPGPGELSGSEGWTTPEPEHTQPIPAPASDQADGAAGDGAEWRTPPPPPPPPPPGAVHPGSDAPGSDAPGSGAPGSGAPGSGYPGSGYPGGYPGSAYPGGAYPGRAYPGGAYPGGGNPGSGNPGSGYPGGYPGGGYPGGGYPAGYVGPGYTGGGYPGAGYPGGGYPGAGYPGSGGRGGQSSTRGTVALIAAVAIAAAGIGAGIAYAARGSSPSASTAAIPPSSGSGNQGFQPPAGSGGQQPGSVVPGSGGPSDISGIAAKADPALVDVNVTFGYQNVGGAGTGIVLTSDGEVLTNNHVIDGATKISVTDLGNGRTYSASVVGYDSTHDIAVLQLQGASGLRTATLSKSAPTVGEQVVAIGNVGGRGGTPTTAGGSITGLNQSITASDSLDGTSEQLTGLIETNADVQEGDSGGSLVNSAGQVIGMDTAASSSYSFQSQSGTQGFAIPISQATTTARQIESGTGSSVVHVGATAFLGVQVQSSDQNSGGFPGQGGSGGPASGAVIAGLVSGGAAQQAGLQTGDVITSLAGQTVDSPTALAKILVGYHPGNSVSIGWTDTEGQPHTATVDLGDGPPA